MTLHVDSYRYLDKLTKQMVTTWIRQETPRPIPWTPLRKPLSDYGRASQLGWHRLKDAAAV